jgi:hypothetical protein
MIVLLVAVNIKCCGSDELLNGPWSFASTLAEKRGNF